MKLLLDSPHPPPPPPPQTPLVFLNIFVPSFIIWNSVFRSNFLYHALGFSSSELNPGLLPWIHFLFATLQKSENFKVAGETWKAPSKTHTSHNTTYLIMINVYPHNYTFFFSGLSLVILLHFVEWLQHSTNSSMVTIYPPAKFHAKPFLIRLAVHRQRDRQIDWQADGQNIISLAYVKIIFFLWKCAL